MLTDACERLNTVGIIGWGKNRKQRILKKFPVFGELQLMEGRNPYWQGDCFFEPVQHKIGICIHGKDGPTQAQYAFFEQFMTRWPNIRRMFVPGLIKFFERWMDTPHSADIFTHYRLGAVHIPEFPADDLTWTLVFDLWMPDEKVHFVYFEMNDLEIKSVFSDTA